MQLYIFFILASLVSSQNRFRYEVSFKPHPQKVKQICKEEKGGEDAFFVNSNLLTVADGVGGWTNKGVDPGLYSKKLCTNVGSHFEQNKKKVIQNPKYLIQLASQNIQHIGSSTICVVTLDENENNANIGDSGYKIFRYENNVLGLVFESPDMQHAFNFPYQIGTNGDDPSVAVTNIHDIKDNDIILVASDGLLDNVFTEDIISIIDTYKESSLLIITEKLKDLAFKNGNDQQFMSPFSVKALQNNIQFKGGKLDDITLVLAKIELYKNQEL